MSECLAYSFFSDPRLVQAKKLILQTLDEHQQKIQAIRPPDPACQISYNQLIEAFSTLRGGKLFYPYLSSGLGNGAWVELADGSIKLDMITGIGVHGMGHSHPRLISAMLDAALSDTVMQGNLQQDEKSATLLTSLIHLATKTGSNLSHAFLTTSGAMANENALKLAFHQHPNATRVLAFEHCFMGRTLALAQVTDKANYRVGLPQTLAVDYVPFYNYCDHSNSIERAVATLKHYLARYPDQHAAMCFELVQGEGGYYPGDRDFFVALMNILVDHNIAILIDEVQTFGRLNAPFAFQYFNLEKYPNIISIGKFSQVCATLFTDTYLPRPGLMSQTFTASTSAIAAAIATIEHMQTGQYYGEHGRINEIHQRFVMNLSKIATNYPTLIQGPFGIGGMIAFTPYDGQIDLAKKLLHELFEQGLIVFLAGQNPTRIRFLPPIAVVTNDQIDLACQLVEAALRKIAPA